MRSLIEPALEEDLLEQVCFGQLCFQSRDVPKQASDGSVCFQYIRGSLLCFVLCQRRVVAGHMGELNERHNRPRPQLVMAGGSRAALGTDLNLCKHLGFGIYRQYITLHMHTELP